MTDGFKFFLGVLIAFTIAAVAIIGAKSVQESQNNTISKAETKAEMLLQ